jgi:acyl-CoA thioesterase FadM
VRFSRVFERVFLAPVRLGDRVLAEVEATELIEKGLRASLAFRCHVDETIVLEGEATVKIPRKSAPPVWNSQIVDEFLPPPRR